MRLRPPYVEGEHYVIEPDTGCWIWQGSRNPAGYGAAWAILSGKQTTAHRAVYEAFVGAIPEGHELHHRCRRPPCVNPAHQMSMTKADHRRLGYPARLWKNSQKTHCKNGHPFDEENTRLKSKVYGGTERVCRTCARERAREKRAENPGPGVNGQSLKTHCPHGHEYTTENTFFTSNGGRACRECRKARGRERREAARQKRRSSS